MTFSQELPTESHRNHFTNYGLETSYSLLHPVTLNDTASIGYALLIHQHHQKLLLFQLFLNVRKPLIVMNFYTVDICHFHRYCWPILCEIPIRSRSAHLHELVFKQLVLRPNSFIHYINLNGNFKVIDLILFFDNYQLFIYH